MSKSKQRRVNKKTNPNAMEWKQQVDKDILEIKSLVSGLIGFAEAMQNWKEADLRYFVPQQKAKEGDEKTNSGSKVESLSKEKGEANDNKEKGTKAKATV